MPEAVAAPVPAPVEAVPPPTAKEFGRVIFELPQGAVTNGIIKNISENRNPNVVAGKEGLPPKVIEDAVDSIFGGKKPTGDKNLVESYDTLNDRLKAVQKLCGKQYDALSDTQKNVLRTALEMRINRTPGLNALFKQLIQGGNSRDGMLDLLLKRGSMQEIANGKIAEALVISEEGSNLLALKDEVGRLETRQKEIKARLDALPKQTSKTTPETQATRVQTLEESVKDLQNRLNTIPEEITDAEDRLETREQYLQSPQGGGMNQAQIDADPRVKRFTKNVSNLKSERKRIQGEVDDAKKQLAKARNLGENTGSYSTLQTEYEEVSKSLSEKRGEYATARVHALKKANDLYQDLVKILPEASKEFIEELKAEVAAANKERVVKDEEKKAEAAKEKGDILAQAESELAASLTQRYLESYTRPGFLWIKASDRLRPDRAMLQDEFRRLLEPNGASRLTEHILRTRPGISKEAIDYLNDPANAKARREFIMKVKAKVYSTVAGDAVQYLNLDRGTQITLAQSEDFITAAEAAFARDSRIKKVVEQATQHGMDDKGAIRRLWEYMPAGGLLGLLMMIFGVAGGGLFRVGK